MSNAATPRENNLQARLRHQMANLDHPNVQIGVFAATLFSSALLLFSVQPMFAKLALPKLGGTPAVWAVSMCFFQAVLLAGYCYAHAINRYLAPRTGVLAHLALLTVTLLALPIGLPASLGDPPAGDAYLWLVGVLAAGVGLPFFAVSANAPLLQAWFARTSHASAKDPYFLYGASNLGSMLALLAYPLLIEPLFGAATQTRVWSASFLGLALLISLSGALMVYMLSKHDAAETNVATSTADVAPVTSEQRAIWTLLATIPSGLMVAVTTYITTDLASAPFLWVIPLALFLATFIVVFRDTLQFNYGLLVKCLPIVVLTLLIVPDLGLRMALSLIAFLMATLVCHRELFLRRPDARHLTEFYLWMSFGGVLGGVFAAIIAPKIFTSVFEFNVLLVAALLCAPGQFFGATQAYDKRRVICVGAVATAMLVAQMFAGEIWGLDGLRGMFKAMAVALVAALIISRNWPEKNVVFTMGLSMIVLAMPDSALTLEVERSFFGTVRVYDHENVRYMRHGTTLHGARRLRLPDGTPVTESVPTTYFHASGPMARGVEAARKVKGSNRPAIANVAFGGMKVGIVGLGTGSLACHAKPGDAFSFYEIDPVVVKMATNPKLFDFISRCQPNAPMIIGDARLTVAKEPNGKFDYLVIDAFSSDTVPVHLMTVEAIKGFFTKVTDDGIMAMHISNRHLDLASAVAATVGEIKGVRAVLVRYKAKPEDLDAQNNVVVLLSRNPRSLDGVAKWPDAQALPLTDVRPWTDDYSDVASAFLRMLW